MIIIEIDIEGAMTCTMEGEQITPDHDAYEHLNDCTSGGDVEGACVYVVEQVGVEFRIVAKNANGDYENRLATDDEMQATCESIYSDSDTDFSDRDNSAMYLVWQAARDVVYDWERDGG